MSSMASVNSIGSVLSVTEEQILQLHQQHYQSLELEVFLKLFNDKKKCAQEDAMVLKALNITHAQVGEKLSRVVKNAETTYELQLQARPINLLSPDNQIPVIEINDEGTFRVSFFSIQILSDYCQFCDHKSKFPITFEVENVATNEKVYVPELTLHFIKAHDYFGKQGKQRIDPALICRILQLPSKSD